VLRRRSLSISAKLGTLMVLYAVAFVALSLVASVQAQNRIMLERRDATRARPGGSFPGQPGEAVDDDAVDRADRPG